MKLPTATALASGVRQLFHYQRLDYADDVLLGNRIKFSNPRAFNDPWDCRPQFSKSVLDDPNVYEQHVEYMTKVHRSILSKSKLITLETNLRTDRSFMGKKIDEFTEGIEIAIKDQYRIYCLSRLRACFLMWAHYTDSHKGICIGFNTANDIFGEALEVTYLDTYPEINLSSLDDAALAIYTLFIKAQQWSYEKEFRLAGKEVATEGFLRLHGGFLSFPPEALEMVIVGCMMPDSDVKRVRQLIACRKSPTALYRAVPAQDRYELQLRQLA